MRAKTGARKKINLSFDEWNVWYISRFQDDEPPKDWPVAPRLIEDVYNITDAVVVGSLLITLLRHSDRVTAACQAQLVNAIAPIHAEPGGPSWRQATFHPFAQASRFARGDVLRVQTRTPSYTNARYGETPIVDAVATHDADAQELVVFAVNRDQNEGVALSIGLRAFPRYRVVEHLVLTDDDPHAVNTQHQPDRVTPETRTAVHEQGDTVEVALPSLSWNVVRLRQDSP